MNENKIYEALLDDRDNEAVNLIQDYMLNYGKNFLFNEETQKDFFNQESKPPQEIIEEIADLVYKEHKEKEKAICEGFEKVLKDNEIEVTSKTRDFIYKNLHNFF